MPDDHYCSLQFEVDFLTFLSSEAYEKDCKTSKQTPDEDKRVRLFITKGFKVYKMFYEPRLHWFAKQQEFLRHLRQDEFYYRNSLRSLSKRKKSNEPSTGSVNVELSDSLLAVSSQDFMQTILELPKECHSSQMTESSDSWFSEVDKL